MSMVCITKKTRDFTSNDTIQSALCLQIQESNLSAIAK